MIDRQVVVSRDPRSRYLVTLRRRCVSTLRTLRHRTGATRDLCSDHVSCHDQRSFGRAAQYRPPGALRHTLARQASAPYLVRLGFARAATVPKVAGWTGVTPPSAAPCRCRVAFGPPQVSYRLDLARLCSHAFRRPISFPNRAAILDPSRACCLPRRKHAVSRTHC